MKKESFTNFSKLLYILLTGLMTICLGVRESSAQACTGATPVFTFDFVTNPVAETEFGGVQRGGECCGGGTNNENCINVIVRVGPETAGAQIDIISGAGAGGSFFASVDCGPHQPAAGTRICLGNSATDIDTVSITFCKPGANLNTYRITSVARPTFPKDTVALGCRDTIRALGMTGVTWTSIFPGAEGEYNNLLSSTSVLQPVFTPTASTPALVRYKVCGSVSLSSCLGINTICDTVDITVTPQWSNVPDQTICEPATTASLGTPPAAATWTFLTGPATPTVVGSTGAVSNMTANGTYTFLLRRTRGDGVCTDTVSITRTAKPNAGSDVSFCAPATTYNLGSSGGNSWSFLDGPALASIDATTGAITNMTANGNYYFQLGSGTCSDTVIVTRNAQQAAPATASSNSPLCVTQTLNLFASAVPGATYQWVGPLGYSSVDQNPTIPNVTALHSGAYKVVAKNTLTGCVSDTVSTIVVVNTIAPAPSASSNSPVCEGGTINLSAIGEPGATYSWTKSGGGYSSNDQNPVIASANPATHTGSYCVSQNANGCVSPDTCVTVTVNPKPVISNVAVANTTSCDSSNGRITITGLINGVSYTINYEKGGVPQTPVVQVASGGQVVITGLTTGTYANISVSNDATSCVSNTFAGPVVIAAPGIPLAPIANSNSPICEGDTVKLTATGEPTASFSWTGPGGYTSSAQNPSIINAIPAQSGSYCVTQIDSGCVSQQVCTSVTVNPKPTISGAAGFNPITCGGTSGTITLTPFIADITYTVFYLRNGIQQGPISLTANGNGEIVIIGLNAATYTNFAVEFSSTNCGSDVFAGNVTLSDPAVPAAPVAGSNSPVCEGSVVNLTATGEPTATFSWTQAGGGFVSNLQNPNISPATLAHSDTFFVTQTDSGCLSAQAFTIVEVKPKPVIGNAVQSNPTACGGGNGTITVSGLAPNTSYTITYERNGSPQSQSPMSNGSGEAQLTGLTQGSYTNIVVMLNGCSSDTFSGTISLTDPQTPNPPVAGSNSPVCEGGAINLTASGEVGATYSWTGPGGYTSSTQNPVISPATLAHSDTFFVTQTVNGCTSQEAYTIVTVNANPVITTAVGTNPAACGGATGSITLSGLTSGEIYSVTYLKDGNPVGPANFLANGSGQIIIPNLTIGTYSDIIVTLNNCASGSAGPVTLVNPPAPNAPTATTNAPVCAGFPLTLGVNATAGATYAWTGPGFSSSDQNPTVSLSAGVLMSGVYKVVVTLNGCQDSSTVNVVVNPNPSANAGVGGEYCFGSGGSVNLGGVPSTASGGSGSYTYLWSPGGATNSNPTVSPASTTVYTVTVTDGNNCSATSSTTVTVNLNPTADAGDPQSICNGGSVIIGGNPTATGGTPGYAYAWSNGADAVANPSVSPGSTTLYTVTVTDNKGCTATDNILVSISAAPFANAGPDQSLAACDTTGIILGGSPAALGTGPFTYLWSPSAGLSDSSVANPTLRNIGSTTGYTLVVTDANGCTAYDEMLATVTGSSLGAVIIPNTPIIWCETTPVNFVTLTALPSGGTGPYSYEWTGFNISSDTGSSTTATVSVAGSYIYSVAVTDATGCEAGASITVTVHPSPVVNAGVADTICNGESVALGSSPTANGGTPPYTYAWNLAPPVSNPVVSPSATTTYVLTVTDTLGCTATSSVTINVNANPVADAGNDQSIQSCNTIGITIGGSPTGTGVAPLTYSWSPSLGLSSDTAANPTVASINSPQTYTVTVTDGNGCTAQDAVSISVTGGSLTVVIVPNTPLAWCAESGSDVTFTAIPLGGQIPYTYSWTGSFLSSTTGNNVTANPNTPGTYTYTVDVEDATGCHVGDTIQVTVYASPSADAGSPEAVCSGTDVTLGGTPTASGGTPGYTYAWDGTVSTASNPVVTVTASTTYRVTVTDINGCIDTATKFVLVNQNPVADAGNDVTIPACTPTGVQIGGSPVASGGTPGYTYSWSPSVFLSSVNTSNPIVSGITADTTYTVVVTDNKGCTASDQVAVHVSGTPVLVSISAGGSSSWCVNSGGSVNLTANVSGGSPSYTYSWSGTNINPTNSSVATVTTNILGENVYRVTVTDAFNCTASATFTVTVNPNPSANAGSAESVCAGANVILGGAPTASGGTPGYIYSWSGGTGVPDATASNPVVTPAITSTYTVVVTDTNGCTATSSKTVTIKTAPVADAGLDKNLSACSSTGVSIGGSPTGSGGSGAPFTYSWSPSAGLSSTTTANPTVSGIDSTTTYTVTVTDAGGCTATDEVIVNVISTPFLVSISSNSATEWCEGSGGNTNLTANISGGILPFTYAWSGTNLSPNNASTVNASPVSAGTYNYTVTVTDGFNCTGSATFSITVNPNPTANAGANQSICNNGTVTLGGDTVASGGTPGYTYLWSNASTVANPSVSPLTTTTYILTVTDTKGCSATSTTTVTVNQNPVANAGSDQTLVNCVSDSVRLGGSPTASGGSGNYTFHWSPATGLNDTSVSNPLLTGIVVSGTYCVTVTDESGCSATDCALITVVQSSLQANAAASSSYCAGSVPPVNVGGSPTASGGTPPYSFAWTGAGLSATNVPNPTAQPTTTTTYTVVVTDANGCTATSTVTITVNPLPLADAGNDTAICAGSCISLGGSPAGSGGTGVLTYTWSPGTGLNSSVIANPTACPGSTISYGLTVTDAQGCSASDNISVIVNPSPNADAGSDIFLSSCSGDSVQLGGSPAGSGGTPSLSYQWTPSSDFNDPTLPNPYYIVSTYGIFFDTLTVTDANGCSATDIVRIIVVSSSVTAEAGNDRSICAGSGTTVQLGGIPTAIGGSVPYSYSWTSSPAGFTSTAANPDVSPNSTTTYYVTVTDAKGCVSFDSVTITVNPAPVADAGNDTTVCGVGVPVQIGTPAESGNTYSWSPTIGINNSSLASPTVTPLANSSYCVTVTNSFGCTASDCVNIIVNSNPVADAGNDQSLVSCSADSVRLGGSPPASGGTPPYTCLWSPADGLSDSSDCNPWLRGLGSPATYTLRVTDALGCYDEDQVFINVTNPTLTVEAGNDIAFCQGFSISVTLGGNPTAIGGALPYLYSWTSNPPGFTSNDPNPTVSPTVTTTYTVVVTDANGCIGQDTVRITINPRPIANAGFPDTVCAGSCLQIGGTQANPTASGGTGSTYTYLWQPTLDTVANPVVCPTVPTVYIVTVTDSLGCTNTGNVTIRTYQNPTALAGIDQTTDACVNSCVTLGEPPLSATGGQQPYSYAWAPTTGMNNSGLARPTVCNLPQGYYEYTVTVTDANGCTGTDAVAVTVDSSTLVANAGPDVSVCANPSCITIGGTFPAQFGNGPYTYSWSPVTGFSCGTLPSVGNPQVRPTTTTTYVLLVTDAHGCTATDAATITVNPSLTVTPNPVQPICSGNSAQIGIAVTGGMPLYTYSWSPGTGLSCTDCSNPVANPTITTTYCVTVTDQTGCTGTACVTVTVNPTPVVCVGNNQTMTACPGSFVQLGCNPTASGGSGNYTYQWSPPVALITPTSSNPLVIGLDSTTTYTLVVTDNASGCTASNSVTVTVNPSTLAAEAGPDVLRCTNTAACSLIGGGGFGYNPTASGGAGGYTYQWSSNPPSVIPGGTGSNPCVAPSGTTTFYVTVTDALGCFAVDSTTMTVDPFIVVDPLPGIGPNDTTICYNSSVQLGGNPTAMGGTPPFTYEWNPTQFLNDNLIANPVAENVTASVTYVVSVTDSLGCTASAQARIRIRALPIADAGPDGVIFDCSPDSIKLGGNPTATGTTGPYTYFWSPQFDTTSFRYPTSANPVLDSLSANTWFTVLVTDFFGCQNTDSTFVTVMPNTMTITINPNATSLCANALTCVPFTATANSLGGGPYSYQWYERFNPTLLSDSSSVVVCPTATTVYEVIANDSRGCEAARTVQVTVNQPPVANISGLAPQYCVSSAPVILTGTPPGGTFSSNGPGISGSTFTPNVVGTWQITYSVTDLATGCQDDTMIVVTVTPLPVVSFTGHSPAYCRGAAPVTLVGTPAGGAFSGPGISGNTFTPDSANIGSNTITYTYTDSLGCSNSASATITVNPLPTVTATAATDSVCVGTSINVTASTSPNVFISWRELPSGTALGNGNPITVSPTGTDYCVEVTVSDVNACSARDTVCIHVTPPPVASISGLNAQYCVNDPAVQLTGSPQGGAFSGGAYVTPAGAFNPAAAGAGIHNVRYLYIDPATGCSDDTIVQVTVNPKPSLSVTGYSLTGYCPTDGTITLTGSHAGGTFYGGIYVSSTGEFNPAVANVGTNIIYYTAADPTTGCRDTIQFGIIVKPRPTITVTPSADTVCLGGSSVLCPNYSIDVTNVQWTSVVGGNNLGSGLNCIIITPPANLNDYCVKAKAVSSNQCYDSVIVCIHVNMPPVAVNDTASTCEEQPVTVNVTANDTDPEGNASTVTVVSSTNGTATVVGGLVTYTPALDFNGTDTLVYALCNVQCPAQCDTALLVIDVCPINDPPVVRDTTIAICRDSAVTVRPNVFDVDGDQLTVVYTLAGANGTLVDNGNGTFTYTPTTGFVGTQEIHVTATDPSQEDSTGVITIIVMPCNHAPVAVDDIVQQWCDIDTLDLKVLANDTDPDGDQLTVTEVFQPGSGQGTASTNGTSIIYTPGSATGTIQFGYVISDSGNPTLRDTGTITITIIPCELDVVNFADTTCLGSAVSVCATDYVTSTFGWTITGITQPANGTVTLISDSCFTYVANQGFTGNDAFGIIVTDSLGHTDAATVTITTFDCLIQAVDEPCDLTETPLNTPVTVDVLANDIIPQGADIVVVIVSDVTNGTATVNSDHTVSVIPATDYQGEITFSYEVCAVTGSFSFCDTATVCVLVKDTNCYIPNAFSPNGDGVNDEFIIPCNEKYENASLRIYNRWGVEVWFSKGSYQNDFAGKNMQDTELPDGTYYLIYEYNDGSGRREAKFVVIQR